MSMVKVLTFLILAMKSLVLSEHSSGYNRIFFVYIFSNNYFIFFFPQDFESDDELRQMLEDFLHNIVERSPIESPEYTGALHLLE